MNVRDIMTAEVIVASPDDDLMRAAQLMESHDFGSLPIGDNGRLIGMLTDRDITIRATASGTDANATPVRDVMTPDIVYCFEDQNVEDAAQLMEDKQIRRLVVLNRKKRLVGIVSLGDLAVKAADDRLSGEALERVSEPALPVR